MAPAAPSRTAVININQHAHFHLPYAYISLILRARILIHNNNQSRGISLCSLNTKIPNQLHPLREKNQKSHRQNRKKKKNGKWNLVLHSRIY